LSQVFLELLLSDQFGLRFAHLWPSVVAIEVGRFGNKWMPIGLQLAFSFGPKSPSDGSRSAPLIQYNV